MAHAINRRSFIRLGAGAAALATLPRSFSGADIRDVEFSFIQVSDTHVSKRPLVDKRRNYDVSSEESIRRCRAVVKAINECSLPYSLIVHTGDVAHTRDTTEDFDLARELLRFNREAYYVPGNHDVGYSQTDGFRKLFEERFGVCNRSFDVAPGLRIALFDSQPLDPRASREDREAAFGRLDKILTPAKPTILFCHVVGVPSFFNNQLQEAWPEEIMLPWTKRLKDGGVFAVLAGHFHRDEQHLVNGVPFYLVEPVINFWGRQTTFRHWILAKGVLVHRTIYVEV
jgi:3',5'-cyclic AMP phosphodiesterase CpdA